MGTLKSGRDVFARLRRALESTDSGVESFVERLGGQLMDSLPEPQALRLERIITLMAQAAEELGYDASAEAIGRRARELAKRPN